MTYFFTLNQYGGSNKLSPGQAIKVLLPTQNGNAGKVLSTDGSTLSWTSFSGGGITSLNGLTAAVQAFAVGTSGTDFNIVSALTTHTFNLPVASATNTGKLSSADWSTFNGKQNALGFTPEDVANKQSGSTTNVNHYYNAPYINTLEDKLEISSFGITLDGLGGVITTGSKGFVIAPYNCTILRWDIISNVSGSIVVDLKRLGVSIIGGGNGPTLSSQSTAGANVSGWTSITISQGDFIEFDVISATTVSRVNLAIRVIRI
jgi:hypothetical protein